MITQTFSWHTGTWYSDIHMTYWYVIFWYSHGKLVRDITIFTWHTCTWYSDIHMAYWYVIFRYSHELILVRDTHKFLWHSGGTKVNLRTTHSHDNRSVPRFKDWHHVRDVIQLWLLISKLLSPWVVNKAVRKRPKNVDFLLAFSSRETTGVKKI